MENDDTTNPAEAEDANIEAEAEVENNEPELDEHGDPSEAEAEGDDELVEIERDGKTYKIPAALKPELMMQADYPRKTQELAAERKAVAEQRSLVDPTPLRNRTKMEQTSLSGGLCCTAANAASSGA